MLLCAQTFFFGGGGELYFMVKLSIPELALSQKNLMGAEMLNKINFIPKCELIVQACGGYEMQN